MVKLIGTALLIATVATVSAAHAETVRVGIDKFKFQPQTVTIRRGDTVEWVNDEKRTPHTIHFQAEGLPESDSMFPGESWKRQFTKPGTYPYRCGPHPEMTGIVEVRR